MNKTNRTPSGCWTQLLRKKRVDKQTSTPLDIQPLTTEPSFLSPLAFQTARIVLRGTFSLENQHHRPSPPAKLHLDYSCSGNPIFGKSSNRMSQPSNVREQIQAPYVNSPESSLHSDDLAGLPNLRNTSPSTVGRVVPSSPPVIDQISDSRVLGDDISTDPHQWSCVPTQPSLTQTQQSDSVLITPTSAPIGPSPEVQFYPNRKHCVCAGCAGAANRRIHCIPVTTIPSAAYRPSTVPVVPSTTTTDSHPFTSHKVFVIPQTHTEFYPVCVPEAVRPTSAGSYLVECVGTNAPVQISPDSMFTGLRRSRCRCHSVSCCRLQWPCEYGREPDYITMNISPPARNPDTNQHHSTNCKVTELDSRIFVRKYAHNLSHTHTQRGEMT
ncbi:hypothetical protein FGIG_04568 [Fasciola gigantica]|uniref:Uncharacterized protein n=1 Tax=Fasciola gigantica TaxID=46835 RepID=A0A504YSL6_FASGI|nr:hypothetical protein FGIG_04568 [Fasciola gigantica]